MIVRQLIQDHDGTSACNQPFRGLPGKADEVRIDQGRSSEDRSLVAAFGEGKVRQCSAGSRATGNYAVGFCGDQLQDLRRDRCIRTSVTLVGLYGHAERFACSLHIVVDEISPRVAEAYEAYVF